MKKLLLGLVLFLLFALQSCLNNKPNPYVIVTPNLEIEDYFESEIPFFLNHELRKDSTDLKASLGRILFYDRRLSYNNSISCGSCHKQSLAFSDGRQFSDGLYNIPTKRNSMSLVNTRFHTASFWEGFTGPLEDHILSPITNHIEMGMRSTDEMVDRLKEIPEYQEIFNSVFDSGINAENVGNAMNTFVSALISYNAKIDIGEEMNFTNFNTAELRGKDLFFGKAKCDNCHRPNNHYSSSWRKNTNIGLDTVYADKGAGNGKFKVPSLRNVELTSPYMHDGRFNTLEEVVEHYSTGIKPHLHLDWILQGDHINLSEQEKSDLVEFLKTFTDESFVSDARFSDPF